MTRLFSRFAKALFASAAELDEPAIAAVSSSLFSEIVRQRDGFNLAGFVAAHGLRPALAAKACERVYVRFLTIAWADHNVSDRELTDLRVISSRLELAPSVVVKLNDEALENELRRRDGLEPVAPPRVGEVASEAAVAKLDGIGALLGKLAARMPKPRSRPALPPRPVLTRPRVDVTKLPGMMLPVALPSPFCGVRRLSIDPPPWAPPTEEELEAALDYAKKPNPHSPKAARLARSLGIDASSLDAVALSARIDAISERQPASERIAVLRRQCEAVGARPDGDSRWNLWQALLARLDAVELAPYDIVLWTQATGLVPNVRRWFSIEEADAMLRDAARLRFRCKACEQSYDREQLFCIECGFPASEVPTLRSVGEIDRHLGLAWWEA